MEADETPEHGLVRELRERFGSETEGTSFVGTTAHAYDHLTLDLLAYTEVYCSGMFVCDARH